MECENFYQGSLQPSPSIGSLSAGYSGSNSKQLTKSPSTVSLAKLWMAHVELISGHNLAIRDRSGVRTCMCVCVVLVYEV